VLETNTRLDEIIIYDEEGIHRGLFGKIALITELRKRRFDTAFILHRSFTKALLAFLAGIKERIGYPTKHRPGLLTVTIEEPDDQVHKVEYFLCILRGSGVRAQSPSYEFFVNEPERRYIDRILDASGVEKDDRLVVVCPGGNWGPKRWPKEKFARLSDLLAEECGVKVIVTGSEKDAALAEDIRKLMEEQAIVVAGKTNLKQLAALLSRASLVVANDTGSMHLAVAVGAPTLALFGPTSPELTGPYGKGRYKVIAAKTECDVPCYDVTCGENRCMQAIAVDEVLAEAKTMLESKYADR
jgi:lipopolysaccharide heptosyltransferase II